MAVSFVVLAARFTIPSPVIPLCDLQPLCNQLYVGASRLDSAWRLFLEGMEDVDDLPKSNGVHGAKSIAGMILDDFKHAGPLPLPGLGARMHAAELRNAKRVAELGLHGTRKAHEVAFRRPDPVQRPLAEHQTTAHRKYP